MAGCWHCSLVAFAEVLDWFGGIEHYLGTAVGSQLQKFWIIAAESNVSMARHFGSLMASSWPWNGVLGSLMASSWPWNGVFCNVLAPSWPWNGVFGGVLAPSWPWNGVLDTLMAPSWPWNDVLGALGRQVGPGTSLETLPRAVQGKKHF